MSKEELIEKLQTVYVGDINALNEMIGYYDGLKQGIEELQQENKQLKDNWNELKNIIEKGIIDSKAGSSQQYYFNTIYKYMQELEQVKDE